MWPNYSINIFQGGCKTDPMLDINTNSENSFIRTETKPWLPDLNKTWAFCTFYSPYWKKSTSFWPEMANLWYPLLRLLHLSFFISKNTFTNNLVWPNYSMNKFQGECKTDPQLDISTNSENSFIKTEKKPWLPNLNKTWSFCMFFLSLLEKIHLILTRNGKFVISPIEIITLELFYFQ